MEKVKIYTLSDPRNNEPRYVGKAKNELKRFSGHITESKKNIKTYKCNWIKKLVREGVKPKIEILDIVPENEWKFWEMYWIAQMKQWGFKLTNSTSGGDGACEEKLYKPVDQYDLEGNFIKSWESITKASEMLNISMGTIVNCCKGRNETANKCVFKYKGENFTLNKCRYSAIIQYDLNGNFINKWNNIMDASRDTNIPKSSILKCCQGKNLTAYNYIFKYKDNELKLEEHYYSPFKSVDQYDLQGNFIKTWNSIIEAGESLNISKSSISNICNGKGVSAGKHIWKFNGDKLILKDHVDPRKSKKIIIQYDLHGNKIKEWEGISEIPKKLNIKVDRIYDCFNGRQKTAGKYVWKYKENNKPIKKIIQQFDLKDKLIKEWDNLKQITLELGIHKSLISRCCVGRSNTCSGYKWKYKKLEEYEFC